VTGAFGDADVRRTAEQRERSSRALDPLAALVAMRAGAGDRIDHDADFWI
jgi:hypothetical protein